MQFSQWKLSSSNFFGLAFAIIFLQRCFNHKPSQRLMSKYIFLHLFIYVANAAIAQVQLSQNTDKKLYESG